jgi:hypothetical protein
MKQEFGQDKAGVPSGPLWVPGGSGDTLWAPDLKEGASHPQTSISVRSLPV